MLLKSWEQLLSIRRIGGFYRTLVSEVKIEESGEEQIQTKRKYVKKTTTERKRSKELLAHFDTPERNYVLNTFPESLLRKKSKVPEGLYNTSETVARTIVDHLKKDLPPERPLIEVFPGPGHITQLLGNETSNPLVLYEPEEKFHKNLCVNSTLLCLCHENLIFINSFRKSLASLQTKT
jgi:Ribosomal RNA adenine dimethylase